MFRAGIVNAGLNENEIVATASIEVVHGHYHAQNVIAATEAVIENADAKPSIYRFVAQSRRPMSRPRQAAAASGGLDKKDRQILHALQADARQSLSALGKRIGLSQPAVSERVRRLEESGVISGYGAKVDFKAVGLPLEGVVRIRTSHERIGAYLALFQSMPEVLQVLRITGEDCFVVHCAFAEPGDLEQIVDKLAAHGTVTTGLVLSKPVDRGPHLLPGP